MTIPDHYTRGTCPNCNEVLATAKRAFEDGVATCSNCGTEMDESNINDRRH